MFFYTPRPKGTLSAISRNIHPNQFFRTCSKKKQKDKQEMFIFFMTHLLIATRSANQKSEC